MLSAEFGTENEDEVIKKILTDGTAQPAEVSSAPPMLALQHHENHSLTHWEQFGSRQGATNDSMSSMRAK